MCMADRPIQTKALPFGYVEYDGDGTIEGFAAVMGNVDSDNERIVNGAFKKTIAESRHKVLLGLDHSIPLGTTTELEEVSRGDLPAEILKAAPDATGGLWCKGQVMQTAENIPHLQRIRDASERGDGPLMSVTLRALQTKGAKTRHGKAITDLIECRLIEWGPQLRLKAINQAARVTRVKATDADDDGIADGAIAFGEAITDGNPAAWSYATGVCDDGSLGVVYPLTLKAVAGSFEDRRGTVEAAMRVSNMFKPAAGSEYGYWDIVGTYADAVVVCQSEPDGMKYYRIPYSILDSDVTLGDRAEVKLSTVVTAKASEGNADVTLSDEIWALAVVRDVAITTKAGAVLSRANLTALDEAMAILTRIREAAAKGTDDEAATPTDAKAMPTAKAVDSTEGEAAHVRTNDVLRALEVDLSMLSTRARMLANVG